MLASPSKHVKMWAGLVPETRPCLVAQAAHRASPCADEPLKNLVEKGIVRSAVGGWGSEPSQVASE